jgi:hypothetical protein
MFYFLFFAGLIFIAIGLVSLVKLGFSKSFLHSNGMSFLVGGIIWFGFSMLEFNGLFLLNLLGSGLFSVVLGLSGLSCLVWRNEIAPVLYKLQLPGFKFIFRNLIDWENSWIVKLYKWALVFAGVVLLLAAYANYFGSIKF